MAAMRFRRPRKLPGTGVRVRIAKKGYAGRTGRGAAGQRPWQAASAFPAFESVRRRSSSSCVLAAGPRVLWSSDKNAVEDLRAVKDAAELETMQAGRPGSSATYLTSWPG